MKVVIFSAQLRQICSWERKAKLKKETLVKFLRRIRLLNDLN